MYSKTSRTGWVIWLSWADGRRDVLVTLHRFCASFLPQMEFWFGVLPIPSAFRSHGTWRGIKGRLTSPFSSSLHHHTFLIHSFKTTDAVRHGFAGLAFPKTWTCALLSFHFRHRHRKSDVANSSLVVLVSPRTLRFRSNVSACSRALNLQNFGPDEDMTSTACCLERQRKARSMLASVRAFDIKIKMPFEVHIRFWLSKIAMQEFDVFASVCSAKTSKVYTYHVCSTPLDQRKRVAWKGDVVVLASAYRTHVVVWYGLPRNLSTLSIIFGEKERNHTSQKQRKKLGMAPRLDDCPITYTEQRAQNLYSIFHT